MSDYHRGLNRSGAGYQPPAPAPAKARRPAQSRTSKRPPSAPPRPKRSLKWQFIKLLLVLLLLGGAIGGGYVWKTYSDVSQYANVFASNISVDGIDLSGLTWEEGSSLVWAQVNAKQNGWYVRLKNDAGEAKSITAETLGISFDPTAALEAAWAIGHDVDADNRKSIFELNQELEAARLQTNAFYSAQQSADTSAIDEILQTLENAAYRAPTDAQILSFNPDDTANPFTFQYETYGQRLDTTAVREQILEMVNTLQSGEILLTTETLAPSVTVDELSQTVSLRFRAITPISTSSTEARTNNIRTAFSRINGTVLQDGQSFSFNDTTGRRELENGYQYAIEYAYGQEQWGVGGGVCQASSTMYLAAIQAGLTILERKPHSMAVSYTEYGMDATVSDTRGREIDFVFRNDTGSPVYITAHVISSSSNSRRLSCEVRIYGQTLGATRYALVTDLVQTIPKPDPVIKEDEDGDYVTYVDETETIKGREGYVVDAYLVTYENNVEVSRVKVSTDTYPERADTIYVGVTPRYEGY